MSLYGSVGVRGGAAQALRNAHATNGFRRNFGDFGDYAGALWDKWAKTVTFVNQAPNEVTDVTPPTPIGSKGLVVVGRSDGSVRVVEGPGDTANHVYSKDSSLAVSLRTPAAAATRHAGTYNPTKAKDGRTTKDRVNVASLAATAADSTGEQGKAVANIIRGFQTGGKNGGLNAAAGAVGVLGPGIIEAAGDFIKSRKDNPRVLARKLAKAKRKCHKTPKGSRRHAKWCHKVEMYKQMIAHLRADQSMADISPAVAGIEGPTDDLPTWLPYAAGGALLLVVVAVAASSRKAA